MPFPKDTIYTSEDYWKLPEGHRAELIDGKLYDMAPPNRIHQKIISGLHYLIRKYIDEKNGSCEVYPAPFAVNLNADDETYVEPDLSIICDERKLTDKGCSGAPDWVIEIVSPSSRKMGYSTKNTLYNYAGVREYWIVDPEKERTTIYHYEEYDAPTVIPFSQPLASGIYPDLVITLSDLL